MDLLKYLYFLFKIINKKNSTYLINLKVKLTAVSLINKMYY